MLKNVCKKVLSVALAATMVFSSAVPSLATEGIFSNEDIQVLEQDGSEFLQEEYSGEDIMEMLDEVGGDEALPDAESDIIIDDNIEDIDTVISDDVVIDEDESQEPSEDEDVDSDEDAVIETTEEEDAAGAEDSVFEESTDAEPEEYKDPAVTYDVYFYMLESDYYYYDSIEVEEGRKLSDKEYEDYIPSEKRPGYTFVGWFEKDATEPYDFDAPIYGELSLYAHWNIIQYTITFHANGGQGTMENFSFTAEDVPFMLPAGTFTKEDYYIDEWHSGYGYEMYYGRSFNVDQAIDSYYFEELIRYANTSDYTIPLYAEWEPVKYPIKFFDEAGYDITDTFSYYVASKLRGYDLPGDYAVWYYKTGYKFLGWTLKDSKGGKERIVEEDDPFDLSDLAEDGYVHLYGKWEIINFEITFNAGVSGIEEVPKTVNISSSEYYSSFLYLDYIFPEIGEEQKENFEGWISDVENTNANPGQSFSSYLGTYFYRIYNDISDDRSSMSDVKTTVKIKLTAAYKLEAEKYTVRIVLDNVDYDQYSNEFYSDAGLAFWASGSNYVFEETPLVTDSYELTGREIGRIGYTLNGWTLTRTDKNGNTDKAKKLKVAATIKGVAGSGDTLILTPIFKRLNRNYKITLKLQGGKFIADENVPQLPESYDYSEYVKLPDSDNMYKYGYYFRGWYTDKEGRGEKYSSVGPGSDLSAGDVTLYAYWGLEDYEVIFTGIDGAYDAQGNPAGAYDVTYLYFNMDLDLSQHIYTKYGYTLAGWDLIDLTDVDDLEDLVDAKAVKSYGTNVKVKNLLAKGIDAENIAALRARWKAVKYNLKYDLNGGKLPKGKTNPKTYTTDQNTVINIPEKAGYVFAGWDITNIEGVLEFTGEYNPSDPIEVKASSVDKGSRGALTLKAMWIPVIYSFRFIDVSGNEAEVTGYDNLIYTDTVNLGSAASQMNTATQSVTGFADSKAGKASYKLTTDYSVSKFKASGGVITLYAAMGNKVNHIVYDFSGFTGAKLKKGFYTYVKSGSDIALPVATCAGYSFKKWIAEGDVLSSDGLSIKAGTDADITLVPEFEPVKYTIKLDPNAKDVKDADDKAVTTIEFGKDFSYADGTGRSGDDTIDITNLPEWYRNGYCFYGFGLSKSAKASDALTTLAELTTKNTVTIYAIWVPEESYVYYSGEVIVENNKDAEFDISSLLSSYNETSKYTLAVHGKTLTLPKPSMKGFKFLGWKLDEYSQDADVTRRNGYVTKVNSGNTSDIIVRPVFRENEYTLRIGLNGGMLKLADGSTFTGNYILGKLRYTENLQYSEEILRKIGAIKSYSKAGCVPAGTFSLNSKKYVPINRLDRLTDKDNGTVTLYFLWEKINIPVPKTIEASLNAEGNRLNLNVPRYKNEMYQYEISTDPNFTTGVIQGYYDGGKTEVYVYQVKSRDYYVRVRAYVEDGVTKPGVFGKWSKTVRVKKNRYSYYLDT